MSAAAGDGFRGMAWKQAISWYATGVLPVMRSMSREQLLAVAHQAEEHSLMNPLHLCGPELQFDVPLWSVKPLSAGQVVAIIVMALWVLCGEDERMASGLMNDWGGVISHATILTREPDGTKKVVPYVVPVAPAEPEPAQKGLFDGLDGEGEAGGLDITGGGGGHGRGRQVPAARKRGGRSRR